MICKRRFLALLALFGATLAPLAPATAQDKGQVVVATGGGIFLDGLRETIYKSFEKATGIKVIEVSGPSMPKIRAMVATGSPEWDVAEVAPGDMLVLSRDGMLEKLNYNAMDQSVFADFPKDAAQPFGVGLIGSATVIAFNTKKYTRETAPKTWADVWDVKKFPGPRVLDAGNGTVPPIEFALMADGVQPSQLYPLDLKRAYASLSRIRPHVVKWTTSSAMRIETIVSGEAVIGEANMGRAMAAKAQGAPIDFVVNQALVEYSFWGILKGSKNLGNAQKFIEFASRAESQAALTNRYPGGFPLNEKALGLLNPEAAKNVPTSPEFRGKTVLKNPEWWALKDASGKSNVETNHAMWTSWSLQK